MPHPRSAIACSVNKGFKFVNLELKVIWVSVNEMFDRNCKTVVVHATSCEKAF